jgi:cyclophilin family peptidyl-prolyl cis-trans isomerase/HEAT repeat protein
VKRHLRCSLSLLVVLIAAACGRTATVTPSVPSPPPRVLLGDADVDALAMLLRMEDARVLDTALVARHLQAGEAEVRGRAALAAGRLGDHAATPLLLRALSDSDARVRTRAAFALGELGDTTHAVVAALTGAALGDTRGAGAEAVAALGRLGTAAGRPVVDSLLTRPRVDAAALHEALLAAWRLPRDPGTFSAVLNHLTAADPETRWRAAYALARSPTPGGVGPLIEATKDADPRVRALAVRGLRPALADTADMREASLAALLSAARDSHPHVTINAIALLPGHRQNDRTTPALIEALGQADANVAVAAAQALAQAGDPAAWQALSAATAAGRPDGLRTAALHAWMRVDSASAAAMAVQWADSSRWLLRMHAARALSRAPGPPSTAALRALARDDHYLVAAEALATIRTRSDTLPDARRVFIEQLTAAHPLVRAAAIRGLAVNAGAADLDLLLQAWERTRNDSIRDAALAAVHALARVRRAGVPVERTFFLRFGEQGPPRDAVVHRAVIDSLGSPPASWAPPASRIDVRPIEFYRGIVRTYVAHVLAGGELPRVIIGTTHGDIILELASADAPLTVHNFVSLIESGYYRDTRWHRVVPNFVIQDGDPRGDGSGGPGYVIRDEINPVRYMRGTLGMALSGPDTGGSQFFITHSPQPHLDGGYTVFGNVVSGMDVVDRVVQEDPIVSMRVAR